MQMSDYNDKINKPIKPGITAKPFEPTLLMEQKVYNTQQTQSKEQKPVPPQYIPVYTPDQTGILPIISVPHEGLNIPQPKVYNLNFGDRFSNFPALNLLYEDYLPTGHKRFTANTIYERDNLIQYLRNSIIKQEDGEEMKLAGERDVLLSYIKILNINPYNSHVNPFKNLAKNFILYSAAYPIKYNENNGKIEIGNPAMGLNVRIYGLTENELKYHRNDDDSKHKFNVWRELKYYEFIKQNIIKKKVSPNFITHILYKLDPDCKIKWDELEIIKNNHNPNFIINQINNNNYKILESAQEPPNEKMKKVKKQTEKITEFINNNINKNNIQASLNPLDPYNKIREAIQYNPQLAYEFQKLGIILNPDESHLKLIDQSHGDKKLLNKFQKIGLFTDNDKKDINKMSQQSIIILTEAPTTNFTEWCSITRENYGAIKRMTSSGFHTKEIWFSIIFQLTYIFAIFEKLDLHIEQLNLNDNFYIKDIKITPNTIGSWVYIVNDISYYIPNYGHILMFDSKYNDINSYHDKTKPKFKINSSKIFNESGDNKEQIHSQFKEIIDPDKFNHLAKINGINTLDDDVLNLLRNLYDAINDGKTTIISLFNNPLYFGCFLHNRIGTKLSKSEIDNINLHLTSKLNPGELCIHRNKGEYYWAIYLGESKKTNQDPVQYPLLNQHDIIIKDDINNTYEIKSKNRVLIQSYNSIDKILPESKNNMRYDNDYIYETYNFGNFLN